MVFQTKNKITISSDHVIVNVSNLRVATLATDNTVIKLRVIKQNI